MNANQLVEWILYESRVPSVSDVCTMPGKSHGECWGCPITSCPRQITPFQIAVVDSEVIAKAIQKLQSNQIWIGKKSGRQILDSLGDNPAAALAALLIESRERFLVNQAVESARVGNQTVEHAAASVRYLNKDSKATKNIYEFRRKVDAG